MSASTAGSLRARPLAYECFRKWRAGARARCVGTQIESLEQSFVLHLSPGVHTIARTTGNVNTRASPVLLRAHNANSSQLRASALPRAHLCS